jgi:predicted pyridoxine 5'-phosphate oxidase superfamily flavin-nucleotide-binding protein
MAEQMANATEAGFYTPEHRALQDRFGTRRLADRWLATDVVTDTLADWQRKMIERAPYLWLATADADGWPDVSYKGGRPGWVKVLADNQTVEFPSYDGNGMFRSLGNIAANPRVGLLFVDFERPKRFRIKGLATLLDDPVVLARHPGAELVVSVMTEVAFRNCPRYVHNASTGELSPFAPDGKHEPPVPEWKEWEDIKPLLPER